MSAPAAKARSEPVTIMQRTSVPRSQPSRASASSLSNGVLRAFRASGRFKVAMPTAPVTSVFTLLMGASCLAFGTIKSGAAGLHNALDRPGTIQFARQPLPAIDQKVMLEAAGIASGLGMIAQGRAAGGNGVLQDFFNGGDQGRDFFLFDG